ncbi:urea transport system ATP-binding protein [Clostridium algifaecis]|uniref:Urea transport system ATP-binding protein n=1 Tax=Clostridium algifaecis TaxID=1472040 RepID=A0ABS4KQM1_9CLOT|nr:urea ABC transporter ATP-binding protein UrtD [Clostridium algifaecis]MBP2032329.1 urea transport system ATP-binding protein [Clostridium algifaecis]
MKNNSILDIEGISVDFQGFKALTDVNISVKYNEIHFLIGPNGAGKTTLLDIICGKTRATSGKILFKGSDIRKKKEYEINRIGIGRKFQAPSVFVNLTVYENMELAVKQNRGIMSIILSSISYEQKKKIMDILNTINLFSEMDKLAGSLSHGQKQWLEIGMLLVQEPELLLLDEPVAGMGKSETQKTGELLKKISKKCSILIVEHDMEFVRNFADTVSVLHEGKNLCEGSVEKVQSDPRVMEVYIGRGSEKSA